ncbi:MAG: holo-ACP synthase [Chitinivibrionales bacterium]|nr:holo-ACP synthase [Chitinivibrionales bacterium]
MIIGIGIDIVEIARIEKLVHTYGKSFLSKVYTPAEINDCPGEIKKGPHFAGRWAIKEAFYKALPDECQKIAHFKSIQALGGGKRPELVICDERLLKLAKVNGIQRVHCSISHERLMCVACVVLEG